MQLLARGAQDAHLTADVGETFWRQRYNRHANFAVESIEQGVQGQVGYGQRVSCTLSRSGDLLAGVVLEVTLRRGVGSTYFSAEHLIKEVVLEIGGQRVDAVTNTWLRLYDELYRKVDAQAANRAMTDFLDKEAVGTVKRFFVRLPFWFDQPSAALPLVALQYHEVTLHITLEDAANVPGIDPSYAPSLEAWGDYVFLDTAERRWFPGTEHRYLIEQTQVTRAPITVSSQPRTAKVDLPFNHPVKYIAWVLKAGAAAHGVFGASTASESDRRQYEACGPLAECGLQLDGQDRFKPRKGAFFRLPHPLSAFGQAPSVGVYVYSFALRPRAAAPSGTLNFSRVDSARLTLTTKAAVLASVDAVAREDDTLAASTTLDTLEVYARNYNVLRVSNGMAGLAFAN